MGASKGLGLAITRALLSRTRADVVAVSRSVVPAEGRLRTVQADIALVESTRALADTITNMPSPLAVILNAATVATEITAAGTISFDMFCRVNAVQIGGMGHVLAAAFPKLLNEGGAFVAISSFSAYAPPVEEPRIAYPASKAYLDMAMRALRLQWGEKIAFTTVHLGNMGENSVGGILSPSYAMVAARLVDRFAAGRFPREINATWPYTLAYKYCFPHLPDRLYALIMRGLFGSNRVRSGGP